MDLLATENPAWLKNDPCPYQSTKLGFKKCGGILVACVHMDFKALLRTAQLAAIKPSSWFPDCAKFRLPFVIMAFACSWEGPGRCVIQF